MDITTAQALVRFGLDGAGRSLSRLTRMPGRAPRYASLTRPYSISARPHRGAGDEGLCVDGTARSVPSWRAMGISAAMPSPCWSWSLVTPAPFG